MLSRREQNRVEQRSRILDAAFGLFAERGFDEVTVAEVADAAGVARATVFNHFQSKQGLVEAITTMVLGAYQGMLDRALDEYAETPTPVIVRALFEYMGGGIESMRRFQRGVFREIARLQLGFDEGGPAQSMGDENRARLVELFGRAQKRGDFERGHDPETLARTFSHLVNGTITDWLFEDDDVSLRERMRAAAEVFLGPVARGPAAAREEPLPDLFPERPWRWSP